jgi:hypothetical protein
LLHAQALIKLADQLKMRRRPTVLETSFDRPPYSIPALRQVPQGSATLRHFVQVEHPTYAHIIDNKLMDLVRSCLSCVICICNLFCAIQVLSNSLRAAGMCAI